MERAEEWRWRSLWHRAQATPAPWLSEAPLPARGSWAEHVNGVETEAKLEALRRSVRPSAVFERAAWKSGTAGKFGRASALQPVGRPKKNKGTVTEI